MKTHQVNKAQQHIPLGAVQLCLPMKTESTQGAGTVLEEKNAYRRYACFLKAASSDLGLWAAYTPQHCNKLERLFLFLLAQVQEHIAVLEQHQHRASAMLLQLRLLHRDINEAVVVVRGVCGLCIVKRHLAEPTGAYWQLIDCVRSLRQKCQIIARFDAPVSLVASRTPKLASA